MKYEILPWLMLFLPIFSAAAITLFTLKHRNVSALLSIGAIVAGFVLTLVFIGANGFHINAESPGIGTPATGCPSAICKLTSASSSTR